MSTDTLSFQYCQKLIILSGDRSKVLLAKRKGEQDYDGVYSFIGGKMETTDTSFIAGMKREKDEEIGEQATVLVLANESRNLLYKKKDGNAMVLPHIACVYKGGTIQLNDEYSEFVWADIDTIDTFQPMIDNIPELTRWAIDKLSGIDTESMVLL